MEDRILPEGIECPHCKEDCDGCGCCDLIKYYNEKYDNEND